MWFLRPLFDYRLSKSPASSFRQRRIGFFRSLLDRLEPPIRILDVGGTGTFWETLGLADLPGIQVTTLNLVLDPCSHPNVKGVVGDARDMSRFPDKSFDVVFSNSLIEHVGGIEDQRKVAQEIVRVGRAYFVQTPNRNFPVEPHFMFPFFQHLPVSTRVFLVTRLGLGWERITDPDVARAEVESIRLLDRKTLESLFPGAQIWCEKFCGLTKSMVAYAGFPEGAPAATRVDRGGQAAAGQEGPGISAAV